VAITMDELIPKSIERRSKVRFGRDVSRMCGDDVGFVIWQERGSVWRIKWFGHGCSVTCGFAQHLCDHLDLKNVEEMIPISLSLLPQGISAGRQSCVDVVMSALRQAVGDDANGPAKYPTEEGAREDNPG